ncbi:unnamed protein product [Amaranthus hypochondriacus]
MADSYAKCTNYGLFIVLGLLFVVTFFVVEFGQTQDEQSSFMQVKPDDLHGKKGKKLVEKLLSAIFDNRQPTFRFSNTQTRTCVQLAYEFIFEKVFNGHVEANSIVEYVASRLNECANRHEST